MGCCHYHPVGEGCDNAFTVDTSRVTFGRGCLVEVGDRARALGMKRVALFSDARVARLPFFEKVRQSLLAAGLDVVVFTDVHIEPTDQSFLEAARFAAEVQPDGYVSLGGGSVIDTCEAANLYATYPADFLTYVNAPVGAGRPVPGPLKPHIACPTTSGTGSEVTGITICDVLSLSAKTGIASDSEAREQTMWAATLAGIAFGNAGVHAPHGMAYAVAGLVRDFRPPGYPDEEPLVPHGMAVIVNAPAVFRYTAGVSPERHLEAARGLGADTRGAAPEDAGEVLARETIRIMRAVGMPNGLGGVGYTEADVAALTEGAFPQQRLLQNAPREMSQPVLSDLFRQALSYW